MKKKILEYCRKKGYTITFLDYVPKGRFWCVTFNENIIADKIFEGEFVNYIMIDANSVYDF